MTNALSDLGFRLFGHLPGLLFDERRAGDQIAARGVDQFDALGAASGGANLFGFEADQFAVAGDDQHFAVFGDRHGGDHLAVLLGGRRVIQKITAARLHAVFRERHLLVAVHGDDADHVIVVAQRDAAHAAGLAPHVTHFLLVEADGHAFVRGQKDLLRAVGQFHDHQLVAFVDAHGDDAVRADVGEFGKLRLLDHALAGDHHSVAAFGEFADRDHAGDPLGRRQTDQVDYRLAAAGRRGVGDFMDFQFIDLPLVGEDHQVAVGRGDEDVRDDVLRPRAHAPAPGPPAPLRFIHRQRRALDVTRMCQRDHHVLVGYQVFERQLDAALDDLCAPFVGVILLNRAQLLDYHVPQTSLVSEDLFQLCDQLDHLFVLVDDLLPFEGREAPKLHVENRLRLNLRELELVDQPLLGVVRGLRRADQLDDLVDDVDGLLQAFQDVRAAPGLLQLVVRAVAHDLATEGDELVERLGQVENLRLAVDDREVDHPERDLHLRHLVQLVQDDLRDGVAFEFDDDPDFLLRGRFAVGLVADFRNALDLLVVDQVGDMFDQLRLVDLKRNLGDDDGVALLGASPDAVNCRPRAKLHHAAPGLVSQLDAFTAVNESPGGKIRPRNHLYQIRGLGVRMLKQLDGRFDDLTQIVRRNLGRHADGDSIRTVDQQVRHARRQHCRFLKLFVVVGDEFDGFLLDVGEHLGGDACQARFSVAVGGRIVSIDATPIALPVNQWVPHREILRHPHHRIVNGAIAVRMIPAQHVADDGGRFPIRFAGRQPLLVHRVKNSSVDGFQAVADVGQRAADDHRHGVVEITTLHLVFNVDLRFQLIVHNENKKNGIAGRSRRLHK